MFIMKRIPHDLMITGNGEIRCVGVIMTTMSKKMGRLLDLDISEPFIKDSSSMQNLEGSVSREVL